jgi:DNA-binding transcriptional LysR family regulator
MEIYQIKHFVAIVVTGSFTKGADRAAVSQSTISISIAKLEAEFGVQLLGPAQGSVWSKSARQFYNYAVQ